MGRRNPHSPFRRGIIRTFRLFHTIAYGCPTTNTTGVREGHRRWMIRTEKCSHSSVRLTSPRHGILSRRKNDVFQCSPTQVGVGLGGRRCYGTCGTLWATKSSFWLVSPHSDHSGILENQLLILFIFGRFDGLAVWRNLVTRYFGFDA